MSKDYDYEEDADRGYDEYKEFMAGLPLWIKEQVKAMGDNISDWDKYCYAQRLYYDKHLQNRAIVRSIWGGEINDD